MVDLTLPPYHFTTLPLYHLPHHTTPSAFCAVSTCHMPHTYLTKNGRAVRRMSFPVELHQLHVLAVCHAG